MRKREDLVGTVNVQSRWGGRNNLHVHYSGTGPLPWGIVSDPAPSLASVSGSRGFGPTPRPLAALHPSLTRRSRPLYDSSADARPLRATMVIRRDVTSTSARRARGRARHQAARSRERSAQARLRLFVGHLTVCLLLGGTEFAALGPPRVRSPGPVHPGGSSELAIRVFKGNQLPTHKKIFQAKAPTCLPWSKKGVL